MHPSNFAKILQGVYENRHQLLVLIPFFFFKLLISAIFPSFFFHKNVSTYALSAD